MFKFIVAVLVLSGFAAGLLIQPASAQQGRKPFHSMSNDEKADVKTAESVDAQYRGALERTRKEGAPATVDPWSNMRGTEATPTKKK